MSWRSRSPTVVGLSGILGFLSSFASFAHLLASSWLAHCLCSCLHFFFPQLFDCHSYFPDNRAVDRWIHVYIYVAYVNNWSVYLQHLQLSNLHCIHSLWQYFFQVRSTTAALWAYLNKHIHIHIYSYLQYTHMCVRVLLINIAEMLQILHFNIKK